MSGKDDGRSPDRKKLKEDDEEVATTLQMNDAPIPSNARQVKVPSHVQNMVAPNEALYSDRSCNNPTCRCLPDRTPNNKGKRGEDAQYWSTYKMYDVVVSDEEVEEDVVEALVQVIESTELSKCSKTNIKAFCAWKPQKVKEGVRYNIDGIFVRQYLCRYQSSGHCTCKLRLRHKSGAKKLELQWFCEGSAHMQSQPRFFAKVEDHRDFQHVRVQGQKLPIAIEEFIQGHVEANPEATKDVVRALVRDDEVEEGKKRFDLTPTQFSSLRSSIEKHFDTVKEKIDKEADRMPMTDTLRDIQEFAEANTFDEKIKDPDFTEHTMFVAGIDLVPVEPPADKDEHAKWLKAGAPKHTIRVALTNIVMSSFVPAIASRADLMNGRIIVSSDMTFKLFIGPCELIDIFCHDGNMNGKLMGFLITANNKACDYYFLSNACQNVTRYACTLDKLPGKAKLPFCLPSPVPPCNMKYPMKYNKETDLFERNPDAPADEFKVQESERYLSSKSCEIRAGISPNAVYYPDLVPRPTNNLAATFSLDIVGISYPTLSDGDISIKQGVGAGIPGCSNIHGTCNVHQLRDLIEAIKAKLKKFIDRGIPPNFHSNKTNKDDKAKDIKRMRNAFCKVMMDHVSKWKFCTNRPLAKIMFQDVLAMLRAGRIADEGGNLMNTESVQFVLAINDLAPNV